MAISGKITRFNLHQLPPYERMQQLRARRAAAAELTQKSANLAASLANIQVNNSTQQANLISKIAMQRISKKA